MTFDKMTIEELTSNLQDYMFTNNNLSRLTKHIIQPILIPKPKQTPNFKQISSNNTKIIVVDSGPYPSPGPTKSSQSSIFKIKIILKNKLIKRFLYARILNLYKKC